MDLSRATWRKSARSAAMGENCVEVAGLPGVVAVRDSKNPAGPKLVFDRTVMTAFVANVKADQYDL